MRLWTHCNSLFLLSQSERLQDRYQPRAAGNWCDQHHGLLCVSLPCHWQLWEVCVYVFVCLCVWVRRKQRDLGQLSNIYSVMCSPHIQDGSELPDRCLQSSWRDHHQWVLASFRCSSSALLWRYTLLCILASFFSLASDELSCCHGGQRWNGKRKQQERQHHFKQRQPSMSATYWRT